MGNNDKYVRIGPHDKIMRWTEITPEMAAEMLKKANPQNRNVLQRVKKMYAADMKANNWNGWNCDTIKISEDGTIIDGHHRLSAIVESGCTVGMYVVYGIEMSAVKTLDRGKKRTTKDTVEMSGLPQRYCRVDVLNTAKGVLLLALGKTYVSDSEVIGFIQEYGESLETAALITNHGQSKNKFKTAFAFAATFCAIEYGCDVVQLRDFFRIANTGFYDYDWQTPAITLSKQYDSDLTRRDVINAHRSGNFKKEYFGLTQAAICDFLNKVVRKKKYSKENLVYSDSFKAKYEKSHNAENTSLTGKNNNS